jgi:hypothetical protein
MSDRPGLDGQGSVFGLKPWRVTDYPDEIEWPASSFGVLWRVDGCVGPRAVFLPASVDSKTDSKTGGQQQISVDTHGHSIGL